MKRKNKVWEAFSTLYSLAVIRPVIGSQRLGL